MAVAVVSTSDIFTSADRDRPVTFHTAIRITANAGTHEGLVFEFGGTSRGCALWVEDDGVSFRAGGSAVSGEEAIASFDSGAELAVGLVMNLVAVAVPGDGRVRLWINGDEQARATATNNEFGGGWAGTNDGAFAAALSGTISADIPAGSQGAPDGFEVIEPLSVYIGQTPKHFH